jgi:dihydropyrimidinase
MYDLVIRGGTLITPAEAYQADLGLVAGRIAAIGLGLAGREALDAGGLLVLPGGVDPHVHLAMDAGVTITSDDWASGTIAAACGGTTTVIDFVEPDLGAPLLPALAARRAQAEAGAAIDFSLHMTLRSGATEVLADVPAVIAAGCTSFKTYLTYGGFRLEDADFLRALTAVGRAGGLVLVHAENHAAIEALRAEALAQGQVAPRFHPTTRPVSTEAEAIERALALAEIARCPLYVVHVSTGRGAEVVARARARGQAAIGETCPQYLLLTEAELDRPGFEGAQFVCSPPLRPADNLPQLWRQLAQGGLSTVGTDHCAYFYEGQKTLGRERFTEIPNGLPGIEARLALLHTFGVRAGRISLQRWVEVCSAGPARVFGLYPRKGALVPGADADIVLFDPERQVTLDRTVLHERTDYTPYAGLALCGYPVATLSRGRLIARDGAFLGEVGRGQFLARRPAR